MKFLFSFAFLALALLPDHAQAQQADCNKLGVWLWYIDITGFQAQAQIADTLRSLGIKRVYVKVADGTPNPTVWPELLDTNLVKAYRSRGIEVWAWSYNYTNNPSGQAEALYQAAKTGYQGFVVDVEMEFDGKTTPLTALFTAFAAQKQQAIAEHKADSTFQLYCTTWGNPKDHNFHLELIDPHVDGFMPQTYVEIWGPTYVNNLENWIEVGNQEYAMLGATKPVHHIAALETGGMTPADLDRFIAKSGPQTSLWRIPGGGVPLSLWNTWRQVNWRKNFCPPSGTEESDSLQPLALSPNPASDFLHIVTGGQPAVLSLYDATGHLVFSKKTDADDTSHLLDVRGYTPGLHFLRLKTTSAERWGKWVKE